MQPTKTALITGYTGQDGTFLTRHLLEQGYKVLGLVRRISTEPPRRTRGKFDFTEYLEDGRLELVEGDLLSVDSLIKILNAHRPHEIYNLAAQSHVGISFKQPEFTIEANFMGVVNLITAIESVGQYGPARYQETVRMYQASTSEMFGDYYKEDPDVSMTEHTPLRPNSPYAIAKAAAHAYCKMKREQGLYIACGILFNHESEIRGGDFVTQKIARGVAHWMDTGEPIHLGNLDAMRDWGYAGDYVKAMALMLQQDQPDDYVVGTGESHSVRDFVNAAFGAVGIELTSTNQGTPEETMTSIRGPRGGTAVVVDPEFYRPNDVNFLNGDSSKIQDLGWEPEHDFESLVKLMVEEARNNG